ncbi:WxL domain-containing protein [Latilactobacillus sakei]|uniref:WxL domain-containing protein n=1 Tax=Latilactobacillus sakei TaxID=1599 RepID=UPI000C12689C|nr:WxL domain-containing protein [Latilactobacillus sakei]QVQ49217.1 WxL domain-containing protein [Latilactobacillus sakei subsp. sakei]SON70504.1 conserved exported protein of unknown function [Latilactobacillus sakei]
MKFTKLTSAALAGATVLSILAPATTTFAATHEGGVIDNGGTPLAQTDKSEVGVSFGDNIDNGNTGFLRLQKVPKVLDFGNHATFDKAFTTFTADGKNYANDKNNQHASYDNSVASKTPLLNAGDDKALTDVANDAWVTVVDKQVTRNKADGMNAATTQKAGDWFLSVAADDTLKTTSGQTIDDANLLFKHSKYALTQDVYKLTNSDQDKDYTADMGKLASTVTKGTESITSGKGAATDALTDTFSLALAKPGTPGTGTPAKYGQLVGHAATDTGSGANVFAWAPEDLQLVMPTSAAVANAIYKTSLTWTLSTGK